MSLKYLAAETGYIHPARMRPLSKLTHLAYHGTEETMSDGYLTLLMTLLKDSTFLPQLRVLAVHPALAAFFIDAAKRKNFRLNSIVAGQQGWLPPKKPCYESIGYDEKRPPIKSPSGFLYLQKAILILIKLAGYTLVPSKP